MKSSLDLVYLLAVTLSGNAGLASLVQNGSVVADCPTLGWCRSACVPGVDRAECENSCSYLADQCCTFCFMSSFGPDARNECIGQCSATVEHQVHNSVLSKTQHRNTTEPLVANKQHDVTERPPVRRASMPSKAKIRPSPVHATTVARAHATVAERQHLRRQQHKQKQEPLVHPAHGLMVPAAPEAGSTVPTASPPSQCQHCSTSSHEDECQTQCEAMHEACTTNCLVVYEDPSSRQPCLDHCISFVAVQSQTAFRTPPPDFDVIEASRVTPPPGPPLSKPLAPTPRSSPQATKAANALHENGIVLPENVGLKLKRRALQSRPTLALAFF